MNSESIIPESRRKALESKKYELCKDEVGLQ